MFKKILNYCELYIQFTPMCFICEKSYIYLFYIEEIWLIYYVYHIYECMLCVFLWLLYNVRLRIFCSHGTSPLTVVKGCNIWFHRRTRYCHFNVHVRNAEISLGLISMFCYMTIWKLILAAKLFCSKSYTWIYFQLDFKKWKISPRTIDNHGYFSTMNAFHKVFFGWKSYATSSEQNCRYISPLTMGGEMGERWQSCHVIALKVGANGDRFSSRHVPAPPTRQFES